MKKVLVVPYDKNWINEFELIKSELLSVLDGLVISIEHVGSTSVEGLSAKPVIDIDVIIKDYNVFESVKENLSLIGYSHEGDLGIKDRQAFKYSEKLHLMKHHLYVCPVYSEELDRHIKFRDYLRSHPKDRDRYSEVKILAAKRFPEDIESYIIAKSPCVAEIISKAVGVNLCVQNVK